MKPIITRVVLITCLILVNLNANAQKESDAILDFGYNVTILDKPEKLNNYVEDLNSLDNFTTPIVAPTALNGFTFGWVGHFEHMDLGFGLRQNKFKTKAVITNTINNEESHYTYKFKMNQFYIPEIVFYPSKSLPIGFGSSLDIMSFKVSRKNPDENRFYRNVTSDYNIGSQLIVRLRWYDDLIAFTVTGFYQTTILKSDFGEYKGEPNKWSPSGYGARAAITIPFDKG